MYKMLKKNIAFDFSFGEICFRLLLLSAIPLIAQSTTALRANSTQFTDQTLASGINSTAVAPLLLQLGPLATYSMLGGGCVGDFNRDGWSDVFLLSGGDEADRLYINNRDGSFTDQALSWGISERHMGIGVCAGDYDGDGWLDLYITSYGPMAQNQPTPGKHILWRNTGANSFENLAVQAGVNSSNPLLPDGFGPSFGDFDADGDLDLFVPQWVYGIGNCLFVNQGDGTFVEGTAQAGCADNFVQAFSSSFVDMDGDGYVELLLAGDYGTSKYYKNQQGNLQDWTSAGGLGLDDNGMGQAVGDFDGDGNLDWYITSIYSSAPISPEVPGSGNMLYLGQGQHNYIEDSIARGVNHGGWGWGALAIDYDHDGWLDLVEVNGWGQPIPGIPNPFLNEPAYLFHNIGNGQFAEVAQQSGFLDDTAGRGLLRFDYDNDGDQDLLVIPYGEPAKLFRNEESQADQHWIRVLLDREERLDLPANGVGATIDLRIGSRWLRSSIFSGASYLSQSELSAHFGLGSHTLVDELIVRWGPSDVQTFYQLPADQSYVVTPSSIQSEAFLRADCNLDASVNLTDVIVLLAFLFPPPGEPGASLGCESACDVNDDNYLQLNDVIVLLGALFQSQSLPDPFPNCAMDPSPGSLACLNNEAACP